MQAQALTIRLDKCVVRFYPEDKQALERYLHKHREKYPEVLQALN